MSRWATWSSGTEKKGMSFSGLQQLVEQGRPVPGDPQEIVQQNGWQHKGYGYYTDGSGQTVARIMDGQLFMFDGEPNQVDKQVDAGNPTPAAAGMKPADRARSMGLQSDGRGGYVDPKSGQKVARTVNNELVFYDQRPGGGAVSDGAGGQALAQDTPSWQDPVTGLVVTPPAKPESAQEIAMVPDPVPAQAPHGFNDFVQGAKLKAYAAQKQQQDIEQEVQQAQSEVDQAYASHPAMDELKVQLQMVIDKASQSGDEYKMDIATRVTDLMNDNAQKYKEYFDTIPEEQHQKLAETLKKYTVQAAKHAWSDDNNGMGQFYTALNSGDPEAIADAKAKAGSNKAVYEEELKYMMDDALGLEKVEISDRFNDTKYLGSENITYKINRGIPIQSSRLGEDPDEQMRIAYDKADEVAREYGMKAPGSMFNVEWEVDERAKGEDKRKLALEAMKAWRQDVLPELEPGMILYNSPADETRERIYKLAGFSETYERFGDRQYALVVRDENGNNTIVPIEMEEQELVPENWRVTDINNMFIEAAHQELDDAQINIVYEALFG